MALIIQKYGGTSVGGIDRIEGVADKVCAARERGDDVIVVLSAMAGETDRLLGLARAISSHGRPNPRELDALLATGEQVTIALLCMALEKRGVTARSFTGIQAGIRTDAAHNKARIEQVDTVALRAQLKLERVPVIAGFQGVDADGNITTLGRGGSDTTAVAVAAALSADECQIYTDVDGVYTTDPRVEPAARRLDCVSFEEMLEMAGQGSKVLQVRSVEFAHKYKVPLRVLSTFTGGAGTAIVESDVVEAARIAGIASSRNEALIEIAGVPPAVDAAWNVLGPLAAARIVTDMLVQTVAADGRLGFAFTVERQEYETARELLAARWLSAGAVVDGNSRVAKVSLVGNGIRQADVASRLYGALAAAAIAVRQTATSEMRISVLVDENQMENAVRALHHEFRLSGPTGAVKVG